MNKDELIKCMKIKLEKLDKTLTNGVNMMIKYTDLHEKYKIQSQKDKDEYNKLAQELK